MLGVDKVRVGMVAAEIRQRVVVARGAVRRAQPVFEDFLGVGAGHRMHGVEAHAEAAGEHLPDRVEVEQALHQLGVVGTGSTTSTAMPPADVVAMVSISTGSKSAIL